MKGKTKGEMGFVLCSVRCPQRISNEIKVPFG
jgi:hypothetical protein